MAPRLIGINHVALEVADLDRSLAFYGSVFELSFRSRSANAAFVDIGDQFIAFMQVDQPRAADGVRHFGLVVADKEAARRALEAAGAEIVPGRRLDFLDPDGNRVEVVQYDQIQFTKSPEFLRGMGLPQLGKTDGALAELREKGLA